MHAQLPPDDDAEIQRYTALRILQSFDTFYGEYCRVPEFARDAFERRDHATSLSLSRERISYYSRSINALVPNLASLLPVDTATEAFWEAVEHGYLDLIHGRYEADLAFAYMHSFRRAVHQVEWEPVEYTFEAGSQDLGSTTKIASDKIFATFALRAQSLDAIVTAILTLPGFSAATPFIPGNGERVANRLGLIIDRITGNGATLARIEVIKAGFYRNRGAYIVGRGVRDDETVFPLVFALLNSDDGIYVDAILSSEAHAHNLFSSTLANFHVTSIYYHELCQFLHTIMPSRPLGLHYSTIGYNHFGKVAVINELRQELQLTGTRLTTAIGAQGTVAIGFASPDSAYNLKVIRNHPTEQYKWGEFKGINSVLAKYRRVHEINRTGSMLDNIIFSNVKLDRNDFEPALLELLVQEADHTVSIDGDDVLFRHLIVQRRMTPLPVFLEQADADDTETAIVNLGYCIKNNASANIFNNDLDARNYGVSRFLKVYLYDYDALEPFVDVKIRTNSDRFDGEDDIPDWYFEDGVIFLPEELESGLMLGNRDLTRLLRRRHGDLFRVDYWEDVQRQLQAGKVPAIRIYPESETLELPDSHTENNEEITEGFYTPEQST